VDLKNRVAVITGGGSGIGRALALTLGRQGASVAVSGRRPDRLSQVVAELEDAGATGLSVPCDVTQPGEVQRAVAAVVEAFGGLDVAVANAGFGVMGRIEDLSLEAWRRQLETNVFGLIATVGAALPELRQRRGRLVLMGSVAAYVTAPGIGAYCASKYAVRAIGETLAMELAGTGVSCTTVHPGFVESEIGQVDNRGVFDPRRTDPRPHRLLWKADDAARVIADAVYRRKRQYVFTAHGKLISFIGRHAPGLLHHAAVRTLAAQQRSPRPTPAGQQKPQI
jgi:NAD(P)-dependent dehydrogenase (short-subunit alcohol dehydrogenase family)